MFLSFGRAKEERYDFGLITDETVLVCDDGVDARCESSLVVGVMVCRWTSRRGKTVHIPITWGRGEAQSTLSTYTLSLHPTNAIINQRNLLRPNRTLKRYTREFNQDTPLSRITASIIRTRASSLIASFTRCDMRNRSLKPAPAWR